MHHHLMDEAEGIRSYVVTMDAGEQVAANIVQLAKDLDLDSSSVSGIGAFQHVRLGYFTPEDSSFIENVVDEQAELLSFISSERGSPLVRALPSLQNDSG